MTDIPATNYNNTEKPLKYWAELAAIRLIMRDAEDPATILDILFEPIRSTNILPPKEKR